MENDKIIKNIDINYEIDKLFSYIREDNIPLIEKIIRTLGIDTHGLSDKEIDNIISNYVFISEKIRSDLLEIEECINNLKKLDIDGVEEYTRKKYRHFSYLNKKARDEIISFSNSKFIPYLLDDKNINYFSRKHDKGLMMRLNSIYDYAVNKKYYDINYDFSSASKFRFTPGLSVFESLKSIEGFTSLKKGSIKDYYTNIRENNMNFKLHEYLSKMVAMNYYISKRSEIFETLSCLYEENKYQSFIALAILQLEGLFHDYCVLIGNKNSTDNTGTIVEKAEKSLKDHWFYELAIFPYYAFDVPVMRNEIAHKGILLSSNCQNVADELLLDLHSLITMICSKINDKYIALLIINDELEELEDKSENNIFDTFLFALFSSFQINEWEFIRVLREPDKYKSEYQEILALAETCIVKYADRSLDDILRYLSGLIYKVNFWQALKEQIEDLVKKDFKHQKNKPYDFIKFAYNIKNDFINVLPKNSIEKETCVQIASLLQQIMEG